MLVTSAATAAPARGLSRAERNELADVLAEGAVEAGFQPIVELATGRVVGWEALARGPRGSTLESPDRLFAAARAAGRLEELDWLCQRNALRAALDAGVRAPCVLFLNIEPDTSGFLPLELRDLYARAGAQMTVCIEVTERALTQRPGDAARPRLRHARDGLRRRARRRRHRRRHARDDEPARARRHQARPAARAAQPRRRRRRGHPRGRGPGRALRRADPRRGRRDPGAGRGRRRARRDARAGLPLRPAQPDDLAARAAARRGRHGRAATRTRATWRRSSSPPAVAPRAAAPTRCCRR